MKLNRPQELTPALQHFFFFFCPRAGMGEGEQPTKRRTHPRTVSSSSLPTVLPEFCLLHLLYQSRLVQAHHYNCAHSFVKTRRTNARAKISVVAFVNTRNYNLQLTCNRKGRARLQSIDWDLPPVFCSPNLRPRYTTKSNTS